MAGASDYLENALLKHVFHGATYTQPTHLYVALLTTAANDASTGSTLVEANYTGYARTQFDDWTTPTTGSLSNNSAITFGACTTGSSTIVGFAIVDADTGGNVICYGTCSLSVSAGITPQFAQNQLTVSLD